MTRLDREDLTRQQTAVTDARREMAEACDALHVEARYLARILASKSRLTSMEALTALATPLVGAMSSVRTTEDALQVALTDLATARGEDL